MPEDLPPRSYGSGVGWGFAVLAAVIAIILLGWGMGGNQGQGWGRGNPIAHMMPPAGDATNGPATRAWIASGKH